MSGASVGHNRLAGNIFHHLSNQLSGRPCEAFTADVKVRIRRDTAEFYYYPDVTVDCSGAADSSFYVSEPRIIFEVLSPGTERIDRGEKLWNYQSIPSLDAYILVDQSRVAVIVYRCTGDLWKMELFTEKADTLDLPSIEGSLPLSAIYERTEL